MTEPDCTPEVATHEPVATAVAESIDKHHQSDPTTNRSSIEVRESSAISYIESTTDISSSTSKQRLDTAGLTRQLSQLPSGEATCVATGEADVCVAGRVCSGGGVGVGGNSSGTVDAPDYWQSVMPPSKKGGFIRSEDEQQMRRSHIERQRQQQPLLEPQPETDKRLQSESHEELVLATNDEQQQQQRPLGDRLSGLNLNLNRCQSIKSAASRELEDRLCLVEAVELEKSQQHQLLPEASTNSSIKDLVRPKSREGSVRKSAIRASVDSRSLCIRTSLVKSSPSSSPKSHSHLQLQSEQTTSPFSVVSVKTTQLRGLSRDLIGRTIKGFLDHFKSSSSKSGKLTTTSNSQITSAQEVIVDKNIRKSVDSNKLIEQNVDDNCRGNLDCLETYTSTAIRLLPYNDQQTLLSSTSLEHSSCNKKNRNFIQISVSCNQMQQQKNNEAAQVSQFATTSGDNAELDEEKSYFKRKHLIARSSNFIAATATTTTNTTSQDQIHQLNMSNTGAQAKGYVVKNKYIIEDKLRKKAAQREHHNVIASAEIASAADVDIDDGDDDDHRKLSYKNATDIMNNYDDSSSTSGEDDQQKEKKNHCFEVNNTCAMLCSDNQDDCKSPPVGVKISISGHGNSGGSGLKKRENWDKNIEFLLAVIGFAVDLGNVWRFPYICYKNGGGAFLVPYTIMFILGGLPIFYLEMSLGQYFSSGCLTVWKRVCPMAKGIGYAMCVLNFFTGLYYNTIISWAVFFFVESFTQVLPWTSCNNSWNRPDCRTIDQRQSSSDSYLLTPLLQQTTQIDLNNSSQAARMNYSSPTKDYFEREVLKFHLSTGIDDLGSIRMPLAIYLAIVFICIYFAIWKGVRSTGKAVWITALLPYFVLIPLLFRGVFLEGAWLGIKYYLSPQWEKIVDVNVWVEAAKQIYFSLGPGFGTLMALSSYNKFNHDCCRDTLIAAAVNYFASFISGLVIFAVLGYMATIEHVNINVVAREGPGLVFQVYPEGLATMRYSSMWSVLFFIMVITLGIDSTFGGLESVITGLCDEYPRVLRAHRSTFIGILIVLIYLCSLPTTTYGGNYVINVLESYGTSLSLLFIVLIETIIVCWLYGADRFCKNLEEMHGRRPGAYWRICWKYISPTLLLLIFIAACGQELEKYHTLKLEEYTYPKWAPTVGLLMTGSSVCCIPIYAIYYLRTKTSGTILERLKIASRPIEGDLRDEKEIYVDALTDKIREENKGHRDTVI